MRKITHPKGVAAALCAAVLCIGVGLGVASIQGVPVGNGSDDLLVKKDTSAATYPLAENYAPESEAKFAQVMHIDNGSGEVLTLADLPSGSYSGFLFSLADTAQGAGEVASVAEEAAKEGLITQVHGSLYEVTSLDTLAGLFSADQLEYVEPDTRVYLVGDIDDDARATEALTTRGGTSNNPAPAYPPSDPYYLSGNLWNLDMLNVEGAWAQGLDGDPYVHNNTPVRDTKVRVAVIDTGLYGTGTSENKHEDIDYTHVVDGKNFVTSDEGEPDVKGHGTFVSGLIAAKVNNSVGVAGLMPGVDIVPCKVFDSTTASTSDVVDAIYYAVDDAHVDVINMSLGGEYNETSLQRACDYAVEQGVLVVASAGNDGVSTPNYPAAYDSVVGVASVDSSQERSTWSQYGKSVFVTGPGEKVTSTYNESETSYKTASGTSFSSPEVAALAAMCRSVYPDMSQDVFKEFLIETSTDLGTKGFDDYYGYGLVNFEAMAQAVLASQTLPWYSLSFNVTDTAGTSIQGATVVLKAAEDITWADDPDEGIEEGSLAIGDVVEAQQDGTFKVHRGVYSYEVSANGYYLGTGTLKTYSAEQTVDVSLEEAYEVVMNVKNSAGDYLSGIHLAVSSSTGRMETPKTNGDGSFVYNLMSGVYSFEASAPVTYEKVSGQFTVQRENKQLTITLNTAAELATVSLSAHDAEEETTLTQVSTALYDAQGMLVSAREDGTYRLARGKEYKAILTRLGYEDAISTFTVEDAETMLLDVAMTAAECSISFRPVTEDSVAVNDATIVVRDASGKVKSPSATDPLRYNLKAGTYSYTLSAPGYEDVVANFSVSIESRTLTVVMSGIPQTVSFSITDAKTGQALEGASVKVMSATNDGAIRANSDGTYSLAPGEYRYGAYCLNYQSKRGSFIVHGDTLSIDISLDPYSGSTEGFAGGSGTVDDPYLIATEDQLRYLANQTDIVRAGRTDADTNQKRSVEGYYQLVADIVLTDAWLPIGNYENSNNYVAFSGTFDGAGHTISGLSTIESDYDAQGLFGVVQNATITNLTVEGNVTGDSYVGGIVGYVRFLYDSEGSDWNTGATRISNCCNRASVTGRYAVGGIAGSTSGSTSSNEDYGTLVSQCCNYGVIHAQRNGDFDRHSSAAGGVVGSAGNCKVEYSYNRATVEAGYVAGGVVGQSLGLAAVYNCYNTGYVYDHVTAAGYEGNSGSIAGRLVKSALSDCYGLIPADENAIYAPIGATDTSTTVANYKMLDRASMWRSDDFVAMLNLDAVTDTMTTSFVAGGSYPLLKWEVSPDAILAEDPYITQDPISPATSYKQDAEAAELTADVDPVADGGVLSWQWFESDGESGSECVPIAEAAGTGTHATYTPSTATAGTRHYFVVFKNTRTADDGRAGSATAKTASATVIVRSVIDAQEPKVTAYNPSAAQQFNTALSTKITTDLMLSVEASTGDGGTLSYQWYKGSSMVGSGTPIEGATDATYYPDTSALGTLYYFVEVTNTYEPGNVASVKTDWASVTITEYTISSYEELMSFRTAVDSGVTFEGLVVTLTCDLDVSRADWEPIGSVEHPFKGTFMGGVGYSGSTEITTHTISGIHIDGAAIGAARGSEVEGADSLGFFGVTEAATICDLVVEGSITGKANRYAGLIVGYALANGSSATVLENCATQASSSVEGKYCIGGLVGYGCVSIKDSANHGSVTAWGFVPTKADNSLDTYSYTTKAVGGVVGYAAAGSVRGCYNTGDVTAKSIDTTAGEKSVYYVGGVVGYGSTTASVLSCFDTGKVTVGTWATRSITFKPAGVCYAGAVVGYQAYDYLYNIHYLDGAAGEGGVGTNSSAGYDYAENHTLAFMKTAYFLGQMQDGYGYGAAFRQSTNGTPHLVWETDKTTGSNLADAAEPYLYDVTIDGVDDITSTWSTYFYQGENAPDVVVWADQVQPEGGHLTYEWQSRPVGGTDDDWTVVEGASGACAATGDHYTASLPISTETTAIAEYRCVVTNTLDGATGLATCENTTSALTIEIRENIGTFALADPSQENSASNPWVIKTPEQLHFLALLVNGETKMVGVDDSSFYQQYLVIDADLDLSGYERWEPIGTGDSNNGSPFMGILDGRGHAITGLQIGTQSVPAAASDYQGLFGSVCYGALRNLCVSGTVNIASGGWMTGGVTAYAYGAAFENVANHVNVTGSVRVGGIAGTIGTCQLKDCFNDGTITVAESSSTSQYAVGGIAGYTFYAREGVEDAGLFNCFNAGDVSCTLAYGTDPRFGALIGDDSTDSTPLSHCYYVLGTATCLNDGSAGTGIGNADGCLEDVEGSFEAVEGSSDPQVAWMLNTGNGEAKNSGRWGVIAQDGTGEGGAGDNAAVQGGTGEEDTTQGGTGEEGTAAQDGAVALAICGADPVYRVNTDADAAQITVSAAYVTAGTGVTVTWREKPGFLVNDVAYGLEDADPTTYTSVKTGETFTMPAGDVAFAITSEQDKSYRYDLYGLVVDEQGVASTNATVAFDDLDNPPTAREGDAVNVTLTVAQGYQIKTVSAEGVFGAKVSVECVDGLHYRFTMPADLVNFTVVVEAEGSAAAKQVPSLGITADNVHIYNANDTYHTGNLVYDTLTLSGTSMGSDRTLTSYNLETASSTPALYEQTYSFADGASHRVTGVSIVALIKQFVDDPTTLIVTTPVLFEAGDGSSYSCTWGELTSLSYNAYTDTTGQPTVRALPALLAFGQDGKPYEDNALHLVFGATSATDDNTARCLSGVTRIAIGEDLNYSQHCYSTYADLSSVGGSDVTVNIYEGTTLAGTKTYSVKDIEALANADRGGIYRGLYSTLVYEDNEESYSGPYSDYYEGYSLYDVLLDAGLPENAAASSPEAKVQFYQLGEWTEAWKTVNVSLGYLAGNGAKGVGDYSGNFTMYGREDGSDTDGIAIRGMAPTLAYGKNDLPLVYASGSTGVSSTAYNYRGPLIAMLPQNEVEGGYVADQTVSACYLGQIDVYLPAPEEPLFSVATSDITEVSGLRIVTYTGDVPEGSVVSVAGKTMLARDGNYVCLLPREQAASLTNGSFSTVEGKTTVVTRGDVNESTTIDIIDAQIAYDIACGKYRDLSVIGEPGWLAADFNLNGEIDASDALAIMHQVHALYRS